jgi:uncharacterized protein (DUF1778 family)
MAVKPNKTEPLSIRLSYPERTALEAAARKDGRSLSGMVRKVLAAWLQQEKLLEGQ